jgi:hypothetical protein
MMAAPGAFIPRGRTRTGLERANPVHGADGNPREIRMRAADYRQSNERRLPCRRYLRTHLRSAASTSPTDQRLAGNRVIPDRLVSLSDPDARPIRKGKPRAPTQFGYSLLLAEEERGFICDHRLQRGNPSDAPQLVPAIERVVAVTGRAPGTVVGDRGFGTAANDQAMEALGVKRIELQRTGTPGKARLALERTRDFRRMRNWWVGIEARISHLKRSPSGCAGPGCAGWAAPAPGSAWGSSPTTCSG